MKFITEMQLSSIPNANIAIYPFIPCFVDGRLQVCEQTRISTNVKPYQRSIILAPLCSKILPIQHLFLMFDNSMNQQASLSFYKKQLLIFPSQSYLLQISLYRRRLLKRQQVLFPQSFHYNSFRRMQKPQPMNTSINQANKSPLNTSKSKAMFSFPRGQRFPHLSESGSLFYDKPSMLNKRAPSFGYGDKVDIAINKPVPSPDKYTLSSDFQKSPKHGFTIAQGRSDCKSVSIFNQTHNPGPGEYNLRGKENSKNLTMSSKLSFPSIWSESIAPGPGAYQLQKVDSNGHCMISKYKSKNCLKIHPASPPKDWRPQPLGPGTYNTNLSSTGKQVLARNKTEKSFVFSKRARQTINEETISPGPGAYQHYSIFGLF